MKNDALSTAAQALAITSNLLAIGIEVGLIAGGIYIYKKISEPEQKALPDNTVMLIPAPSKPTMKERLSKIKNIIKVVID